MGRNYHEAKKLSSNIPRIAILNLNRDACKGYFVLKILMSVKVIQVMYNLALPKNGPKPKSPERVGITNTIPFTMKQLCLAMALLFSLYGNTKAETTVSLNDMNSATAVKEIDPNLVKMGAERFLDLTPAKYHEMTGQRLGIKNAVALKAAQIKVKNELGDMQNSDPDIDKNVYILLAIFGLAWIAMGLFSDWSGSDWIINLLLTMLCWLPGLIHALTKMKDYYK